jgi:hypothetical protein
VACIIGIANILLKGVPKAPERKIYREATKPVGDACREDGTLKDADEMVWPNSPTELEPDNNDSEKRKTYMRDVEVFTLPHVFRAESKRSPRTVRAVRGLS